MARVLVQILLVCGSAACGGRAATEMSSLASANDFTGGGFAEIEIDMTAEDAALDELAWAELQRTSAECGDLVRLEPSAMLGDLTDAEIRCLDKALRRAERQTAKDKISRVLLADAWAKGDKHRWEGIARRHVQAVGRSDPDICFQLSAYLLGLNPERMDEAMKWAETALDNRSAWEGERYVTRVYGLHRIRSMAAAKKWKWLENEYARAPSPQGQADASGARDLAKTVAREWLEVARTSGQDDTIPQQMCDAAAGTAEFCRDL